MTEMVERVARALARDFNRYHFGRGDSDVGWEENESAARAAIAAMREPTEEVAREAFSKVATEDWLDFLRGHRAMIEAALSHKPE